MPASASSTNVGSGGRTPRALPSRTANGGTGGARLRRTGNGTSSAAASRGSAASSGGMWRFYTDDSPGIKVGPVPVLVMSLVFIACVFVLHIWGKYTRS
ncbi:sec61 translocon subunit beta [Brevipalpus obovatus]|uniref:sec61 translocon subunit beta n=1 Tax=Brevipalpus obovatus TaxID=246614 RepID=UPI003D9E5B88